MVRFTGQKNALNNDKRWGPIRNVYIQYASDPMTFFSPDLLFHKPDWLIGVGRFAEQMARRALADRDVRIGSILHPSPASPAANRNWAEKATRQMEDLKVWIEG